jgi:hypothetical protein
MTRWLSAFLLMLLACSGASAAEPAPAAPAGSCAANVTESRIGERPLPLLQGDPAHGFRTACSVPWKILSPGGKPLPVLQCYQGSMLQLRTAAVCGSDAGPLWISTRWVKTDAPVPKAQARAAPAQASCEQLQTGAWAGTRDYSYTCSSAQRDLTPAPAATPAKPADAAPPPAAPGH